MECKNAFALLLTVAIWFGCTPVIAHAARQNSAAPSPAQAVQPAPPHLRDQDQKDAQHIIPGAYRMIYTVTELDGAKRIGSQRYAMVLDVSAPHSHLRIDSHVPVHVGTSTSPLYDMEHISFIIDANLRKFANGLELTTAVMQGSLAKSAEQVSGSPPPVTRDFDFTTTTLLTENKPVTIGQFDIPGSTRSLQVQVELTKIP